MTNDTFSRILAVLLHVIGEHLLGELDAHLPRRRLRDLVGIDAVEVLAGRVRIGIADRLAAAAGRHEAAAERAHQAVSSRGPDATMRCLHLVGEDLGVVRAAGCGRR